MKNSLSKIFSYTKEETRVVYRLFGIKISVPNFEFTKSQIEIQDKYNLDELKNAKSLIVCMVPHSRIITGGIQSIHSICKYSREICPESVCVISTVPGKYTYSHNHLFKNDEKIYRWEQIIENTENLEKLIVHIPEYFAGKFYKSLKKSEIEILKSIKDLQINIINQNIELMPEPKKLKDLYKLTNNITQTFGHNRYATQENCDKWNMPSHFLSVHIDLSGYKSYPFEEKEKIIVLSPDKCSYKDAVVQKLKTELPDFKLVTVNKMTFDEYMDLIARAYFTITFGEGMDGYFLLPSIVGSIGGAVYSEKFFPNHSWKNIKTVYNSYAEMLNNLANDIKYLIQNREEYKNLTELIKVKHDEIYKIESFKDNIYKFYLKQYSFSNDKKGIKK